MNKKIVESMFNKAIENGEKIKLLDPKSELLHISKNEGIKFVFEEESVSKKNK